MITAEDLKQTRVDKDAFAEGEEIGEKRGEQRGRQIGEQIGEQRAKLEAISRMLKLKLSIEVIAKSLDLPLLL